MNNFKKLAATMLALLMAAPLSLFAACGGGNEEGGNSDSSAQGAPVCETHDWGNTGECKNCGSILKIPAADPAAEYINPRKPSSGVGGTGEEYNRYECVEDYYVFEVGTAGTTWLSFAVKEAGQYALISTENTKGVKVTRYDASEQYVSYPGYEGKVLDDNNFISTVNCGKMYFSSSWRATFCLRGKAGSTVKVRFVKIDDPAWLPEYIHTEMVPTEINGKKAEDGPAGKIPVEVDYNTEYFYDETAGFYRMGTKENPGDIIYVAITKSASRLLSDMSFATVNYSGNNLNLGNGKDEKGNFLVCDYPYFIMQNEDGSNADNCYENFVNVDGLYPANKELKKLCELYALKNPPLDLTEESDVDVADHWLAACYHYETVAKGEERNPYVVGEGTVDVTTFEYDWTHYIVKYGDYNVAGQPALFKCTVSFDSNNVKVMYNDTEYTSSFEIETDCDNGVMLKIAAIDGMEIEFSLTIIGGDPVNPDEFVIPDEDLI